MNQGRFTHLRALLEKLKTTNYLSGNDDFDYTLLCAFEDFKFEIRSNWVLITAQPQRLEYLKMLEFDLNKAAKYLKDERSFLRQIAVPRAKMEDGSILMDIFTDYLEVFRNEKYPSLGGYPNLETSEAHRKFKYYQSQILFSKKSLMLVESYVKRLNKPNKTESINNKIEVFEDLFKDKSEIKKIFKAIQEYIGADEKWMTNIWADISSLIEVLTRKGYLKKTTKEKTSALFAKKFGFKKTKRTLRGKPNHLVIELEKLIPNRI